MAWAVLATDLCAAPGPRTEKTEITGQVADYDKRRGILILKDFKGWDRKMMQPHGFVKWRKTRRWLDQFDKTHAAVLVKPDEIKKVRKGSRVRIEGYSYFTDEWTVYPDYEKLTIIK